MLEKLLKAFALDQHKLVGDQAAMRYRPCRHFDEEVKASCGLSPFTCRGEAETRGLVGFHGEVSCATCVVSVECESSGIAIEGQHAWSEERGKQVMNKWRKKGRWSSVVDETRRIQERPWRWVEWRIVKAQSASSGVFERAQSHVYMLRIDRQHRLSVEVVMCGLGECATV